MDLVAPIIMVAHLSVATEVTLDNINSLDKMKGTINNKSTLLDILRRYKIAYEDENGTRTYLVDPKGLTTFASDVNKHYRNNQIRVDKGLCCDALLKCFIELEQRQYGWKQLVKVSRVPGLPKTCRPYSLAINEEDIPAVEAIANDYIVEYSGLLPMVFSNLSWLTVAPSNG